MSHGQGMRLDPRLDNTVIATSSQKMHALRTIVNLPILCEEI